MSLWNNSGEAALGALLGVQVTVRRVGRNGGPPPPMSPALLEALEADLVEFVAKPDDLHCWLDESKGSGVESSQ